MKKIFLMFSSKVKVKLPAYCSHAEDSFMLKIEQQSKTDLESNSKDNSSEYKQMQIYYLLAIQ